MSVPSLNASFAYCQKEFLTPAWGRGRPAQNFSRELSFRGQRGQEHFSIGRSRIGIVSVTRRRVGVGHLVICIWIGIGVWRGGGGWARVRVYPITAGAVDIDVGIVAPAVAVILQNVPAGNVSEEPSLVPAWVVDISSILSFEPSIGIPLIKPYIACS